MSEREPTIADNFMVTAQALGLSPRQRREGLDQLAAAEVRSTDTTNNESEDKR